MIGCRIDFDGERPADRGAARLLYAAVREALTNAVRHAGADTAHRLHPPQAPGYHVEISDNGRA
jgi:signal transduction histidine kinase